MEFLVEFEVNGPHAAHESGVAARESVEAA